MIVASADEPRPRGLERRQARPDEGPCAACKVKRLGTLARYRRVGTDRWVLACSSRCFQLAEAGRA